MPFTRMKCLRWADFVNICRITHITFLIACLAIAGIPPFSGFFSKDEILAAVFEKSTFWGIWMTVVAGLTCILYVPFIL